MTKSTTRFSLVPMLVMAAVMAATLVPVSGTAAQGSTQREYNDVVSRLEETRRKVAETEARQRAVRNQIASTDALRREVITQLEELSVQLSGAQSRLNVAERELADVQQLLRVKTEELQATVEELEAAFHALRERAVQVYKSGPVTFVDYLVGAGSMRELLSRLEVLAYVFESDNERIHTIDEIKTRVEAERAEVEKLRQEAAERVAAVERERNQVFGLRRGVQGQRQSLDAEVRQQYSTLGELERARETYLRQQRELEAASQRIGAMLSGRGGTASVGPGGMIWPTSGPVTSGYGWRTHPVFGTRRFHAGIDIGAPTGQPVAAAASGTVVSAGWNGGYGNVVVIDHGGGLGSVYAHLSSIQTSTGATLGQGDRLGRVGCTGTCTGPHLHFEVRVNGNPQNPMRYLR